MDADLRTQCALLPQNSSPSIAGQTLQVGGVTIPISGGEVASMSTGKRRARVGQTLCACLFIPRCCGKDSQRPSLLVHPTPRHDCLMQGASARRAAEEDSTRCVDSFSSFSVILFAVSSKQQIVCLHKEQIAALEDANNWPTPVPLPDLAKCWRRDMDAAESTDEALADYLHNVGAGNTNSESGEEVQPSALLLCSHLM